MLIGLMVESKNLSPLHKHYKSLQVFFSMVKEVAIVYPVAGLSSRFGGKIKQFARIGPNGETLIEYSLKQSTKAGFSKIIFIVSEKTERIFKIMLGDRFRGIPIEYVLQEFDSKERDKPWGTAEAVCCTKDFLDCPFVFCNGDDIYGENTFKILFNHLQESEESATIGYELIDVIPEEGSVHRGIFKTNEKGYVKKLIETFDIEKEKLDEKNLKEDSLCSMNLFALYPEVIEELNKRLIKFKLDNKGDRKIEFLIPREISRLVEEKRIKMKIYHTPDKWFGVTNPEDEEIVRELLKNNNLLTPKTY